MLEKQARRIIQLIGAVIPITMTTIEILSRGWFVAPKESRTTYHSRVFKCTLRFSPTTISPPPLRTTTTFLSKKWWVGTEGCCAQDNKLIINTVINEGTQVKFCQKDEEAYKQFVRINKLGPKILVQMTPSNSNIWNSVIKEIIGVVT